MISSLSEEKGLLRMTKGREIASLLARLAMTGEDDRGRRLP